MNIFNKRTLRNYTAAIALAGLSLPMLGCGVFNKEEAEQPAFAPPAAAIVEVAEQAPEPVYVGDSLEDAVEEAAPAPVVEAASEPAAPQFATTYTPTNGEGMWQAAEKLIGEGKINITYKQIPSWIKAVAEKNELTGDTLLVKKLADGSGEWDCDADGLVDQWSAGQEYNIDVIVDGEQAIPHYHDMRNSANDACDPCEDEVVAAPVVYKFDGGIIDLVTREPEPEPVRKVRVREPFPIEKVKVREPLAQAPIPEPRQKKELIPAPEQEYEPIIRNTTFNEEGDVNIAIGIDAVNIGIPDAPPQKAKEPVPLDIKVEELEVSDSLEGWYAGLAAGAGTVNIQNTFTTDNPCLGPMTCEADRSYDTTFLQLEGGFLSPNTRFDMKIPFTHGEDANQPSSPFGDLYGSSEQIDAKGVSLELEQAILKTKGNFFLSGLVEAQMLDVEESYGGRMASIPIQEQQNLEGALGLRVGKGDFDKSYVSAGPKVVIHQIDEVENDYCSTCGNTDVDTALEATLDFDLDLQKVWFNKQGEPSVRFKLDSNFGMNNPIWSNSEEEITGNDGYHWGANLRLSKIFPNAFGGKGTAEIGGMIDFFGNHDLWEPTAYQDGTFRPYEFDLKESMTTGNAAGIFARFTF